MSGTPGQRGLCVVKTKGGMGNRMLCAASGVLWARAAGREVFVDWRDETYSRARENSFPQFFDNPGVLVDAPAGRPGGVRPPVWRDHLDRSVSQMLHAYDPAKHSSLRVHRKYSLDPNRADYPEPTVVFWYYMGRFAAIAPLARARVPGYEGLSVGGVASKALREELPLRGEIAGRVAEFTASGWAERVIGAHVRHSDLAVDPLRIARATETMLTRLPGAAVFLATDNRAVEDLFRGRFARVITTPKWFPPEGASMHQNAACADPRQNGVEALVDMHLLSRCHAIVYASHSTFGEVARLLSDIPPRLTIDIDRRNPALLAKRLLRRLAE